MAATALGGWWLLGKDSTQSSLSFGEAEAAEQFAALDCQARYFDSSPALALMFAGAKLYFTKPDFASAHEAENATLLDYIWDIPQTFLLTITNPGAVLGLIAIFGGVSTFVEIEGYIDALTMVAAIMGGSFAYWLVVSRLISGIRHTLDEAKMVQFSRWAALALIAFGCLLIGEMIMKRPGFFLGRV